MAEFEPLGIVMSGREPTPGGFHIILTLIGSLKPSRRSAMIFKSSAPYCTSGARGSSMRMENGADSQTDT